MRLFAYSGLLESSSVILVASMLISPLMGPILAGVFGTVVADSSLRYYHIFIYWVILIMT